MNIYIFVSVFGKFITIAHPSQGRFTVSLSIVVARPNFPCNALAKVSSVGLIVDNSLWKILVKGIIRCIVVCSWSHKLR